MEELKHVIALLLEDAKRLQQIEPNAGTEARIFIAKQALKTGDAQSHTRANFIAHTPLPLPCDGDGVDGTKLRVEIRNCQHSYIATPMDKPRRLRALASPVMGLRGKS